MSDRRTLIADGNHAAASVAYRVSEVIAIYPITPSSPMGELSDEWAAARRPSVWGVVPRVVEMQSEGGAAGAVHGALQGGTLATTFTASQGLLLMIPDMYKIAGELSPLVIHVAARAVATHALSIFGDHSDVMACRATGFAFLASASVQEAHDLACIAHMATLRARVPFLHFMDGFRTSHEIARLEELGDADLRVLLDEDLVRAHRARALDPEHPVVRGTAHNPDTFFQAREAANPFHDACPAILEEEMERFAARTGRAYRAFDYHGHPEAERVLVVMGSAAETARETVDWLVARGERVGLVQVRLYRPFSADRLLAALPASVRAVAVLDRTKEPGSPGEPLYLDVRAALAEAAEDGRRVPEARIVGGRYGLASKEFTPAMVRAVLDELREAAPRRGFTVGIVDDVTSTSLAVDDRFDLEPDDVTRAVFYGLGSDGTVGAVKSVAKILGQDPVRDVQAYFEYDSKKAGAMTVSHLRSGPRPIRSHYRIRRAGYVACHQFSFLDRIDVLETAAEKATVLLDAPYPASELWDRLPGEVQETVLAKRLEVHAIDAHAIARRAGIEGKTSAVLETCFLVLSGTLPADEAIAKVKQAVEASYGRKSPDVVRRNHAAIDQALAGLARVSVPDRPTAARRRRDPVSADAPDFVRRVTAMLLERKGDLLPVSAFPVDGTWPVGTARFEKRALAREIPVWDAELCIQCNKCALVCPHAAIRVKAYDPAVLAAAPPTFRSVPYRGAEHAGSAYTVQVAPEDCTGCTLCARVCPAVDKAAPGGADSPTPDHPHHKALDMEPVAPLLDAERHNWEYFLSLPDPPRAAVKPDLKGAQLLPPLFEFSGACAGCGETPYVKLLTQLFGDRLIVANATGCSSIFGGNLPTTPYTAGRDGRGPAWSNSLFEDNAEFGLGIRLAVDQLRAAAEAALRELAPEVGDALTARLLAKVASADEAAIAERRGDVESLRARLRSMSGPLAAGLSALADHLAPRSVWIVGGDGWAYDIGYGGLDHVLASGEKVNVLVLDTEVYSNTGGQQSKATPLAASARFATAGKAAPKKDLALLAMTMGSVYVARIALGAKDAQTVKALHEAESYPGPSLVLAFSPCIAHGYDLGDGLDQQRLAVATGHWPLLRYDPRRAAQGLEPLQLDAPPPKTDLADFCSHEDRFRSVERQDPERYRLLLDRARAEVRRRYALYQAIGGKAAAGEAPARTG